MTPYRGYYFRILALQGKNAPGWREKLHRWRQNDKGFAFVAYPAEYPSSGLMTFIVDEDGVVNQKDLGKKSDVLSKGMTGYNPDSSWRKAEDLIRASSLEAAH